jgi:hypothetical protein
MVHKCAAALRQITTDLDRLHDNVEHVVSTRN